jgi:hypothetical protein
MISQAGDLARRLARDAEAMCRHYLSNGQRCGRYWVAGDVMNTPGRSLYVRLQGPESGPGAAGKWTDAATGEHGDLLDLIARNRDLDCLGEVMDEARSFLALPRPPKPTGFIAPKRREGGSPEAACRLFRAGRLGLCAAVACASAKPLTPSPPAKALKPCSRSKPPSPCCR